MKTNPTPAIYTYNKCRQNSLSKISGEIITLSLRQEVALFLRKVKSCVKNSWTMELNLKMYDCLARKKDANVVKTRGKVKILNTLISINLLRWERILDRLSLLFSFKFSKQKQ